MKNVSNYILFLFISAIVISCSSGKSAFNKGNYYDATLKAVKTLRVKPDSKKALEMIQQSYPMSLDYYRQKISALSASNNQDKYLSIVETYSLLNNLADEISRCPAALEVLKPVVYFHDQQKSAEVLALNEQYEIALNLLETKNIDDARLAYKRLQWVYQKNSDFKDIEDQLIFAKDLGTLKVVIEHLPELHSNYEIDSRVFYYRLFDRIVKSTNKEFIRFYKPELAQELDITPHEIVRVQFLDFNIGTVIEREHENSYESDSLIVGTYTDRDGDDHNVLGTVSVETIVYEREVKAKGILDISIINFQTDEIIRNQKFTEEYYWKNEWATYNGDERAVPDKILKLTNEKQRIPPSPQEMFLLYSDRIFDSSLSFLRSYYRKQ